MNHKKTLFILIIFFVFAFESAAQGRKNTPTITYSKLIRNKESYLDKNVRIKAFWIYGFEWSFLCDLDCKYREAETWVEFIDEDGLCKDSKEKLKKVSDNLDNKAEVIFVGKLYEGSFGQFGVYPYQFKVSCIEKLEILKTD